MGNFISSFLRRAFDFKEHRRIIMLGLDAAGKTTILYKMATGESICTIPTIGFNVETLSFKNLEFNVWDIGGQEKIRPLWRHYFDRTDAIIFVVDSNDQNRFDEVRDTLRWLLRDEESLRTCSVLLFANKVDLPNAASPSQLISSLGFDELARGHEWYVQASNANSGDGLVEGFNWLATSLKKKRPVGAR